MKKIKKFKIPIYSHEVFRKAKKRKIELDKLGLSDDKAIKEYASSLAALLEPATVFDYFEACHIHSKILMPPKAAACTCGIFTIGDKLDTKLKTIEDENEIKLIHAACDVFMNTGINFIKDLIAKEAALESFELGDIDYFYNMSLLCEKENDLPENSEKANSKEILISALKELQAEKIGVSLNENGELTPKFTSAFTIGWFPKSKKSGRVAP
ncbi:MAG: hypothetical protein L6420_02790 [Elusimicrobia bacterium]|nr:hypothetical protein [Elusimicrobiota bacterium]